MNVNQSSDYFTFFFTGLATEFSGVFGMIGDHAWEDIAKFAIIVLISFASRFGHAWIANKYKSKVRETTKEEAPIIESEKIPEP